MKPGLLILPFIAILVTAIGAAIGSSFPETKWLSYVGLSLGLGILVLWILLDIQGLKGVFSRKGAKYGASSGLVVLLGLAVISGVAILGARPRFNKSIDLTRDKLNTLSPQSLKVIQNQLDAKATIQITAFLVDEKIQNEFRDLIKLYQSQGANFSIENIDPRTDPTRATAEKITEGNTVIFKLGSQERRLTTFTEEKITNTLMNLLKGKTKKIYFTAGHGESSLKASDTQGLSTIATELENNKYQISELNILERGTIPDDADSVVIAGPRYDLKTEEISALDQYLKQGGALLVMAPTAVQLQNLNKFMESYGIGLEDTYLVMPPELSQTRAYAPNSVLLTEFDSLNPMTRDFASQSAVAVQSKNTRSLRQIEDNPNKLKVTLLVKTHPAMFTVDGVRTPADLNGVTEARLIQGPKPVAAIAAGQIGQKPSTSQDLKKEDIKDQKEVSAKETRLIVLGTNIATNESSYMSENKDLFLNMSNYLLQDEEFIAIRPKDPTKSRLDIASGKATLSLLLLSWVYPFCFLGAGTYSWLKRRRA